MRLHRPPTEVSEHMTLTLFSVEGLALWPI